MRLDQYSAATFTRGRPLWIEVLWRLLQILFVSSPIPGSWHRAMLLRLFGARIGKGVTLKPRIRITFPWRLEVGDHAWIGEAAWLDNLMDVRIGEHCCISQEVYLCTGNHDWRSPTFELDAKPISVMSHAWIGARAVIGPGVVIQEGVVLTLGSVATRDLNSWGIYQGNPAHLIKRRELERKR